MAKKSTGRAANLGKWLHPAKGVTKTVAPQKSPAISVGAADVGEPKTKAKKRPPIQNGL